MAIIQEVVDQVLQAFRETRLQPLQGEYFEVQEDGTRCACAVGSLAHANTFGTDSCGSVEASLDRQYGYQFSTGLEEGFDGLFPTFKGEAYENGHDTGKAIWEALHRETRD